jgi:regulator of cell morphogenesis and NO signaling
MNIAIDIERNTDQLAADMSLAAIALRSDAYAAVLDHFRLDFCCRGRRTLAEACTQIGLDVERVLAELRAQAAARTAAGAVVNDWNHRPLPAVIDFIVDTHHAFTRSAIARITPLIAKVMRAHGQAHSELARVSVAFADLAAELEPHMLREDRVLFPYMRALASPEGAPPAPFGTARNPVRRMMQEHDRAAELLAEIATATGDFVAPAGACTSYRALYAALAELRIDLMKHVSIENNVLFPRALALEESQDRRLLRQA